MKTRTLGNTGEPLSAIGLGCMSMSHHYGKRSEGSSRETLARALESGITFFDSANVYGRGHNETFIGALLRPVRQRVFVATKCGFSMDPEVSGRAVDGRPESILKACDDSLSRLGFEAIDLYYLHRPDPQVPIEDSVGALAELVRAGKVRYIGLSEVNARTLKRAAVEHTIAAVQSEYSIFSRQVEVEVLPLCRELGVGFIPFSPLGRGMLTGAINSASDLGDETDLRTRQWPRFSAQHLQANMDLVAEITAIARSKGCTPAQLSLAWVLAQGQDIIPIPGTARVNHLEDNVGAVDVALSEAEIASLGALADRVSGPRYPDAMGGLAAVDTPERG